MKKSGKIFYVIDFDSTFIKVEAMEELARIALKGRKDKDEVLREIERLTEAGMSGEMPFPTALQRRLELIDIDRDDIRLLVKRLKKKVSTSVSRNKKFFKENSKNIYIVSGGFKEFIGPVVKDYYIPEKNVFANEFKFDKEGKVTGYDKDSILAKKGGKIKLIKSLKPDGEVYVLGDGYTDYELKKAGVAKKFFAFTENINREIVTEKADFITPSMDEFLYVNKLPMAISYPKNRIKVLLLEKIHKQAEKIFKDEGYQVETVTGSLSEEELSERIKGVSILGIRSKTEVTKNVLENADKLIAVGAFCIGTKQVNQQECLKRGIAVFNAPFSNTRSVVELTLGEIIVLIRKVYERSNLLHKGHWQKSAAGSYEIRGKKLGIIGYGKIGSQLSVLAESLGMDVCYYDRTDTLALGNATRCATLNELLKKSDVITLHIDDNPGNKDFIGEREFARMKDGVIFINMSRGFVVDLKALAKYVKSGKISGAAVDVFPQEPKNNEEKFKSILQGLPNVILTPHIGGSTEEAQEDIARFVPNKIIEFVNKGDSMFSVNFPNIQLPEFKKSHRLIHIHTNEPGILAKINETLADSNINIEGQYLKTNETIGYVITDIGKNYDDKLIREMKNIPHTIKFRVLY
jgi:D-3-phosphoglycerate dehydrogenase / 2-oxoglutarate reductase